MQVSTLIAGVQKCGTTSLHAMLAAHPDVVTHTDGQWPYFLHQEDYHEQYQRVCQAYFPPGSAGKHVLARDTSVSASESALRRLKQLCPDVRLVLMLRDPVSRAYSAYCFAHSKGYEPNARFDDLIHDQESHHDCIDKYLVHNYVPLGYYHRMLKRIEGVFGVDQMVVLRAEDLRERPVATCREVFARMGLPAYDAPQLERNATRQSRSRRLHQYLKQDSALKRTAKALMPRGVRRRVIRAVHAANTSSHRYPPLNATQVDRLAALYREENTLLARDYGVHYRC